MIAWANHLLHSIVGVLNRLAAGGLAQLRI